MASEVSHGAGPRPADPPPQSAPPTGSLVGATTSDPPPRMAASSARSRHSSTPSSGGGLKRSAISHVSGAPMSGHTRPRQQTRSATASSPSGPQRATGSLRRHAAPVLPVRLCHQVFGPQHGRHGGTACVLEVRRRHPCQRLRRWSRHREGRRRPPASACAAHRGGAAGAALPLSHATQAQRPRGYAEAAGTPSAASSHAPRGQSRRQAPAGSVQTHGAHPS